MRPSKPYAQPNSNTAENMSKLISASSFRNMQLDSIEEDKPYALIKKDTEIRKIVLAVNRFMGLDEVLTALKPKDEKAQDEFMIQTAKVIAKKYRDPEEPMPTGFLTYAEFSYPDYIKRELLEIVSKHVMIDAAIESNNNYIIDFLNDEKARTKCNEMPIWLYSAVESETIMLESLIKKIYPDKFTLLMTLDHFVRDFVMLIALKKASRYTVIVPCTFQRPIPLQMPSEDDGKKIIVMDATFFNELASENNRYLLNDDSRRAIESYLGNGYTASFLKVIIPIDFSLAASMYEYNNSAFDKDDEEDDVSIELELGKEEAEDEDGNKIEEDTTSRMIDSMASALINLIPGRSKFTTAETAKKE